MIFFISFDFFLVSLFNFFLKKFFVKFFYSPSSDCGGESVSHNISTLQHSQWQQQNGRRSVPDTILLGYRKTHWWVPARAPTVHQSQTGGKPWVARDTLQTSSL